MWKLMLRSEKSASATKSICIDNIKTHITFIPLTFEGATCSFQMVALWSNSGIAYFLAYFFVCHVYVQYQDISYHTPMIWVMDMLQLEESLLKIQLW